MYEMIIKKKNNEISSNQHFGKKLKFIEMGKYLLGWEKG